MFVVVEWKICLVVVKFNVKFIFVVFLDNEIFNCWRLNNIKRLFLLVNSYEKRNNCYLLGVMI